MVDEVMNDVTEQLANAREVLLQTDGAGTLGIVSSVDTVNQIYTLNSTPFGTRLLQAGLTVDIVNPATNLKRGSVTIDYNFNFLGSSQTFGYSTANVPGAQANDIVRVQGVTDGAPVGIYGLAYFISTSTQGSTLGVTRANSPFMHCRGCISDPETVLGWKWSSVQRKDPPPLVRSGRSKRRPKGLHLALFEAHVRKPPRNGWG